MAEVQCEADFRAALLEVLSSQPRGRIFGRKLEGDALREWSAQLELVCYSPYGSKVDFPSHFADLTMWVARVSAFATAAHAPARKAKAKASKASKAKASDKSAAASGDLVGRKTPHQLRNMDLDAPRPASADADFRAARQKERAKRSGDSGSRGKKMVTLLGDELE